MTAAAGAVTTFRVSPLLPPGPASNFGYYVFRDVAGLLFRTVFRLSLADVRPIPEGPVLLAANHRSYIDPLVLGQVTTRRVTFMMKAKYYDRPALNWFCRMSRCIVVDEAGDKKASLRDTEAALAAGHVVGIFPEGHIPEDGRPLPPQPGIAWLARRTGVPVIPVHIGGTRDVLRKGRRRPGLARLTLRTGEPLRAADYPDGRAGQQAFVTDLMAAIQRLGDAPARR